MSAISGRPSAHSRMKSATDTDDTARQHLKSPYIQVTVVSIRNLDALDQGNIEPYVVMHYGESRSETKVIQAEEELTDSYEFDVTVRLQPLLLKIMDKDEYGKHSLVTSITIPETYFPQWKGEPHDVFIRIEEGDFSESEDDYMRTCTLSDELIMLNESQLDSSPYLHLRVLYVSESCLNLLRVAFTDHSIRTTATETFTLYTVEVTRGDGCKWTSTVRFSQISALRSSLVSLFPEFKAVKFPARTVLECFSGLCRGMSRFDSERIEQRRQAMEDFVNSVLRKQKYLSEPLMEMLDAQGHRRRVSQDF